MSEINKTISLQKKVTITTDDLKEIDLAFLSCQIGTEYNTFGVNIQIINKEYYEANIDVLKNEYEEFKEEAEKEAASYGWSIFDVGITNG
nr:MAG TPA: hypothetical protein [Herelleviridae sp.]